MAKIGTLFGVTRKCTTFPSIKRCRHRQCFSGHREFIVAVTEASASVMRDGAFGLTDVCKWQIYNWPVHSH